MSEEKSIDRMPDEEQASDAGGPDDSAVEILSIGEEGDELGAGPPATIDAEEVRRLQGELASANERYLRLRADFDNFRKRVERERQEVGRYALLEPLRDLLPVVDNLERALAAPGDAGDLRKGVEMILRQLQEVLRRLGLAAVPAVGARFDPSVHEAVSQEESEAVGVPTVVAELQRGYRLHERLLRPALVRVAMPQDGAPDAEATGMPENLPQA